MLLGILAGAAVSQPQQAPCLCYNKPHMEMSIKAVLHDVLPGYLDSNSRMSKLFDEQEGRLLSSLSTLVDQIIRQLTADPKYHIINEGFFKYIETKALAVQQESIRKLDLVQQENIQKINSMSSSIRWQALGCGTLGGVLGFGLCSITAALVTRQ